MSVEVMRTTTVGEAPALEGDLFPLAARVAGMSMSKTMAVSALADQLRRAGADVIDLGAGEPDFPTPENIRRAAVAAIETGHTKYTAAAGTPNLKTCDLRALCRGLRCSIRTSGSARRCRRKTSYLQCHCYAH